MKTQLANCALSTLQSRQTPVLESLALRHQLSVLQRSVGRPRLFRWDRGLRVLLSRLWSGWRDSLLIIHPATVVGWHRKGVRLYWRWKSGEPGRPRIPRETRILIRRMSIENPTWGAPSIHGELTKLGINLTEPTIAKYMARSWKPFSQTWKTFLQNHMKVTVAVDFFTVPTATLVKTARKSPWQNPYVERVIGSARRECLAHMIIFGERHLREVLREYLDYYHETRTHLGLEKDCPEPRKV